QFGPALESLRENDKSRFHRLAAMREAIEKACPIEIAEARNARRIRMGFEIAPGRELSQSGVHLLDLRLRPGPARFGQTLVRPQLEPVLAFRRREHVHDAAVERSLFSADVAKQFGEVAHKLHGLCASSEPPETVVYDLFSFARQAQQF